MNPTELTLTITLNLQTGQVGVHGPIDNKVMAYSMLENARDAIYEYNRKRAENLVQPAPMDFSLPKLD